MKTTNLKSFLASLRQGAERAGLTDRADRPSPKNCGTCGVLLAPEWNEHLALWTFTACAVCDHKSDAARRLQAYEAAVHRARVPIPMRHLSMVEREGRTTLQTDRKNRSLAQACENWDGRRWLIATGSVGSGKTSWLTALLMEHFFRNPTCRGLWTSEQRLYRKASIHGEKSAGGRDRVIQESIDAEVLLLDDLGAGRRDLTEWQGGAIRDLSMERHLCASPTLLTTNLTMEAIGKRYGDHVASRLDEMSGGMISVNGDDRRTKKDNARR